MPQSFRSITRIGIASLFFLWPGFVYGQPGSSSSATAQVASARIAWEGKPKITRYRLQLARNEQFNDIIFDKVIQGREYRVTEIPAGKYFWRVAPAASETGAYSKPLPVVIEARSSPEPVEPPKPTLLSPPGDIGWRTAAGLIDQPVAARLRSGSNFDLVGVNSYGMVYAINGENGVALWSARYRPSAKKGEPTNSDGSPPFAPLLIERKDKPVAVLVAFDGGVRALDGPTGRELWRVPLAGEAITGAVLNSESEASATMVVFDNSHTLSFMKGDTGQVISQTKLDGLIVGSPVAVKVKNENGVLLALNNGTLDVRNMAGVSILAIRIDSALTTGPHVVRSPRGDLVMVGTEAGLVALAAADLSPIWRVATEADAPHGAFASADIDRDGTEDLVMVTRRGRIVAINVATGKIKWFTEGAVDATRAAFADLNGDGTTDVLVAGGSAFALGFSGKDGTLIWKADDPSPARTVDNAASPRVLVAATFGSGGVPLLVGADPGRTGLQAVGLPSGSLK